MGGFGIKPQPCGAVSGWDSWSLARVVRQGPRRFGIKCLFVFSIYASVILCATERITRPEQPVTAGQLPGQDRTHTAANHKTARSFYELN